MKQVRPKKNLGQHFLTDLSIAKRIADTVDEPFANLPVLEVGPGMGVMTQYLVEKPRPFKVVEIDRESVAYLQEHFPSLYNNIIGGDFLLRMASQPGHKQYGILSVLIQAWYQVEYLFTVEPGVFNPPPKVQSAVIRMTRNDVADLGCDEQLFRRVVKTTFNQRRKMLRVSLRQLLPSESPFFEIHASLLTRRPEQLSIPEFVDLTNKVAAAL